MTDDFEMLYPLPQGIFCIDRDYNILFWNQLLEIWTGIDRNEAEGKNAKELFPDLNKRFYDLMISQVFEVGSTAVFSYQLHKDLFDFTKFSNNNLCIQSQVVRSHSTRTDDQIIALFSLQDISPIISQMELIKEVKDKVLDLLERMKVTEDELRISNEELEKAANTDPLTLLKNRRSMMELLEDEERRHNRYNTVFSILLADIDGFKKFNDEHGHGCGDFILKKISTLFNTTIRPTDSVCRWGGEEFLFLLPETNSEEAGQLAERIRLAVASEIFCFEKQNHRVTMTFGAACIKEENSLTKLISHADKSLYHGKNNGKNRVVLYSELID